MSNSSDDNNSFNIEKIRSDFPILSHPLSSGKPLVFLDSGASAQKPICVIDKERECYLQYYANAHRGIYEFGVRIDEELENSRKKVQQFINAEETEEIIFTSGTTMSINLVAYSWGRKYLNSGDEIVLNEMEHHANLVPWQVLAKEKNLKLKFIPLKNGELDLSNPDVFLSDRTKLIAVTGMSNVLGTINPIDQLTQLAHEKNALILVDAAQSAPHLPIDVKTSDIDFLAFSGHKVYGPSGIGILYAKLSLLKEMDPFLTGGGMIDRVYKDHSTWGEVPSRFEAGTIPIAQAIALGTAIDYVSNLGFEAMHAHETQLLNYAHEKLKDIPNLTIHGPENVSKKGSIVSFTIQDAHPQDIASLLDRKGIAVRSGHHCTMPLHDLLGISASTRASFGIYNMRSDVDSLYEGIMFSLERLRLI